MNIIPVGAVDTLDRTGLGNCFTASLIPADLLQQTGSGTSRALEDPKKRRNWLVFYSEIQSERDSEFMEMKS